MLDWLEEWLQTEWPELEVFCTSVTEEWANATLVGPRARAGAGGAGAAVSASPDFPFMTMREADIAGIPARVFRVSFSGELSYEINVPADRGLALWERLIEAGAAHGITPYGTEAMHVLRAEKGYIIVGQETDGSVTPLDLGLAGLVAARQGFPRPPLAGARAIAVRPDRKQLVGLLPDDPKLRAARGGRSSSPSWRPGAPMLGHVTSSYFGARIGRSFALALVEGGRARHGEPVWAVARRPRSRGAHLPAGVLRSAKAGAAMAELRRCAAGGAPAVAIARRRGIAGGAGLRPDRGAASRPPLPAYLAGLPLPLEPNRVAAMGAVRVLWLGPDEWLVDCAEGEAPDLLPRLDARSTAAAPRSPICRRAARSSRSPARRRARCSKRAAASTCIRAPLAPASARRPCSPACR